MYDDDEAYHTEMKKTMLRTLSCMDFSDGDQDRLPVFLSSQKTGKTLYIINTSTLGLCGAYNYNLFKTIDPELRDEDELLLIGQKGLSHYHDKPYHLYTDYIDLMDHYTYSAVRRMRHFIVRLYKTKKYTSIVLVYTQYKNSLTFIPTLHTLLPLNPKEEGSTGKQDLNGPLLEPTPEAVLDQILPHYLDASLYRKLMESQLSELASRRNAMETATDSADKIQAQLQLEYNKARQNAITQEITEVVAGANAGRQKDEED